MSSWTKICFQSPQLCDHLIRADDLFSPEVPSRRNMGLHLNLNLHSLQPELANLNASPDERGGGGGGGVEAGV